MNEAVMHLRNILPGIWKHRWTALLAAIPVGVILAFMVARVPDKFEASARVHVDTQTILQPLLKGLTVQPNLNEQIRMMARTLLSRPNLEQVLKFADLDLKFVDPVKQDEYLKQLGKTIQFQSAGRTNLYTINYRSGTPEEALRIVQGLLDVFVEKSIGDKRRDGDQARKFIDQQISLYEQKLVQAENALKEFKLRNLGRMPSSQQDYVGKSTLAQQEFQAALAELRQATSARNALQREAALESPDSGVREDEFAFSQTAPPTTETDLRLQAANTQLDGLLIRYTESHPDVQNVKFVIGELEKRRAQERAEFREAIAAQPPAEVTSTIRGSTAYNAIRASLAEAEARVASLRSRVATAKENVDAIRLDAQSATEIETALAQLNRDYDVNKKSFERLLGSRESAEMSDNLNRSTNLAEFRIVDPPRAEPNSVSPNRLMLMLAAFAASIAAGLAVALLRTFIKPVFYDPDALSEITKHKTLGVITTVSGPAVRFARAIGHLTFSSLTLGYVGVFAAITWYLSRYGVPTEISSIVLPGPLTRIPGVI